MTELSTILGGGIVEAKRQLEERLKRYIEKRNVIVVMAIAFLGLSLLFHLMRCRDDRRLKAMHAAEMQAL